MKELKVTNDYVFKKIFAKKGNESILKDFLIAVLEIPIERIEVLKDVYLERELEESKLGILDIKATLNNNIIVNIEMQVKDYWIQFIGNVSKEGVKKAMEANKEIKKAQEELEYLTGDEAERRIAELREKAIRDEKANLRGAREEGKEEGIKETAKRLKEMKLGIDSIMEATGLTKEEIEKL